MICLQAINEVSPSFGTFIPLKISSLSLIFASPPKGIKPLLGLNTKKNLSLPCIFGASLPFASSVTYNILVSSAIPLEPAETKAAETPLGKI